jgi:protein-S-isoprenylcysteine O-methyltransferase Ste14
MSGGEIGRFEIVQHTLARWRVPLGFLSAALALRLADPTVASLRWGLVVALAGETIRIWAAGHVEKGREVTTSGPYRFVRHPLYVGSAIMAVGFGIAAANVAVSVVVVLYVGLAIGAAIRTEEATLRARFGGQYDDYASGRVRGGERRFSLERAMRNREYRAVAGVGAMMFLLALKAWGYWPGAV